MMNEYPETETLSVTAAQPSWFVIATVLFVSFSIAAALYVVWLTTPPSDFTGSKSFTITEGMSARAIADAAAAEQLVRSPLLLFAILVHQHDPTQIYAGTYRFEHPQSVFAVATELASRNTEEDLLRVTFPEGITRVTMADIAAAILPNFDTDEYLALTNDKEGYLFPDTYFVPIDFTAADLAGLQQEVFEETFDNFTLASTSLLTDAYELITLASILEREANDESSMKMVSGILQNRLRIGMALQADATIEYVLDTPLNELQPGALARELRELDSPYNTYKYPGLPPTPIGNPGNTALEAAHNPTPSNYLYYITGTDGEFYYAETLDGHNLNIARYLR